MRPLVVLLLVLGALTALLFALASLSDSGRQGNDSGGIAVATEPDGSPRTDAELVAPTLPESPVSASAGGEEPTRQALKPELEPRGGPKVEFGSIVGMVVDPSGQPIADARVGLLDTKFTAMGEDIYALRGIDPPKPVLKAVTQADGAFQFEKLDPRKEWSLVVTHDRYLAYSTGEVPIKIPEGGEWNEHITLEPGQTSGGVVRDARTGQPIQGALLVVDGPFARMNRKKSPGRLEATTDASGAYSFANIGATPTQVRVLTVSAPGYATQVHTNFALAALGEAPTRFKNVQEPARVEGRQMDFELEPGKVIAGKVVDPERRGVAGMEVEALSQTGTVSCTAVAKSGAGGEFLLDGLAEGIYTVRVTASAYDANPLQRVEAGTTDVVIELFEQAVVTGKVVDSSGQPLTRFVVKARVANDISKAFGAVTAQASFKDRKDGTFELKGVPEGSYVIEGVADGYASCFSDTFTATQGLVTSDVVVRMTRGGSLSGRVFDAYGNVPVAGAEVTTVDNDWIEGQIWELFGAMEPTATTKATVFTDSDGKFEIDIVTPAVYQIKVKAKGYSPASVKDVIVSEGQETEVAAIQLIKGAVIRGVVYGPNKVVQPGASVQLTPADQSLDGNRATRADGAGRFVIDNARPGTYQLSATRPSSGSTNPFEAIGDMRQSQIEITIEDGNVYDFDLHIGSAGGN